MKFVEVAANCSDKLPAWTGIAFEASSICCSSFFQKLQVKKPAFVYESPCTSPKIDMGSACESSCISPKIDLGYVYESPCIFPKINLCIFYESLCTSPKIDLGSACESSCISPKIDLGSVYESPCISPILTLYFYNVQNRTIAVTLGTLRMRLTSSSVPVQGCTLTLPLVMKE
jgi:hypothetical protein